ncbi:acyl-CoA-binding domain-containing protein 6-like [Stegodyphus dumicola]|uniref:acyl-CoA-binding domain-containing protein 6-like n=1 Tax=Stegodyphus dumicola TaxID=202533 RepID=UPI0015AE6F53|nr:acyl-CoA-binding domain-containing protein 6-like [Stegodyphus dumicola]
MDDDDVFDNDDDLTEAFKRATDFVTYNASVMQQDDLLYLYGRYKQANFGACNEPMPGILKFRNRSKWSAWNKLGNMSKEDAMKEYIDRVTLLSPEWDSANTVDKSEKKHYGPVNSTHLRTDPELKEESKTIFDFVKEGNLNKLELLFSSNPELRDKTDEDGLSLLHWACDRGYSDIAKFLISAGAEVNCQDKDGQTPLHYASSCGHENVIKLLMQNGAKVNIYDSDGLTASDVAYNTSVKDLVNINSV